MSEALLAFWQGAFGSWFAIASGTLVRATPLLVLGLAVTIAFRAGVINIGAEGQLMMGAVGATTIAFLVEGVPTPIALVLVLLGAALMGSAWSAVAAWLRARFGVLEVISTIMLNFIALYLVGWLVRGPLQEPTHAYPQSREIAASLHLPLLFVGQRTHLGVVIGIALALGAAWVLHRTAVGFRVRAVGALPSAAASAGRIDVLRVSTGAFLVSGALAGLAGGVEVAGVTYALYEGLSPGYGYAAIAVALLARLEPLLVIPSALLFGALEAGAAAIQRDAGVPATTAAILEALVILAVLAATARRERR